MSEKRSLTRKKVEGPGTSSSAGQSSSVSTPSDRDTGANARLPSLRTPRDLTLGGVRKKTFTPNIPTRREKQKETSEKPEPRESSKDRGRFHEGQGRGRGQRGRGRGRGGNVETLQSQGVFAYGPANQPNLKTAASSSSSGTSGQRDTTSSSAPTRPTIKLDQLSQKRETHEETQMILDKLAPDEGFITDIYNDDLLKPVMLPLAHIKIKTDEIKVKSDQASGDVDKKDSKKKIDLISKSERSEDGGGLVTDDNNLSCLSLFGPTEEGTDKNAGQLIFIQFPDVMPASSAEVDEKPIKQEPGQTKETEREGVGRVTLKDLPEGHLGKLRIHKSGKAKLHFGHVTLDVHRGSSSSYYQDLISIQVEEGGANSYVLGEINDKLICTPDFESLLKARSKSMPQF